MSTPDRPFLSWLRTYGGIPARPGYGAQPHGSEAKRRAGYTLGQANQSGRPGGLCKAGPLPVRGATSRDGLLRAKDAALRPEKPEVQTPSSALFLPGAEKSSIKTTV